MNIFKQAFGIDISMDTIDTRYGYIDFNQAFYSTKSQSFKNSLAGHKKFLKWALINKLSDSLPFVFVMEVTGVYYENLAHFLFNNNLQVAVVLPNKIRNFAKSLEAKSKTDPIDSAAITRFALERKQTLWKPSNPQIKVIRELTREYHSLKEISTEVKNQIHAKKHAFSCDKSSLKRKRKLITIIDKQSDDILKQIKAIIKTIPKLKQKIDNLDTIKGIGFITIVTVFSETNGFELTSSAKQLTSYAGLDVVFNNSGKRIGKTSISKKGSKFIRKALFMPALSAARFNHNLKELYNRLIIKGKNKKLALIAVARKLLTLMFSIWKNNTVYITNYKFSRI
jgi:transposase